MALAAFRKRKLSLKIGDEAIWLLAMGIHGSRLRTAGTSVPQLYQRNPD